MARYYVNNTPGASGTSTSPYDTWAKAAHWTSTVARMSSSGDFIYFASSHAETNSTPAAAASWGWLGTSTSPVRVISADRLSGEPPSTMVFGASISTTAANNMVVVSTNAWVYFYGMAFNAGTASTAADLNLNNGTGRVVYERCRFSCGAQATGSDLFASAGGVTELIDCSTIVTHANTAFVIQTAAGVLIIKGGQTLSTTPNPLFEGGNPGSRFYVEGFDCSSLINSFNFINSGAANHQVSVRNCKVPESWSGNLNASVVISDRSIYELMNSDNADTNYRLAVRQSYGNVYHETTIVKTGGATDGVTPISWNVSSNTQAEWSHQPACSPEIVRWNTTVASPITCTVDLLHANATTLTNREVWLDVQYLGTASRPLSLFASSATTYRAPSSYVSISNADWTSTGLTGPIRQLVSTSITPQEAGFIHAKVMLTQSSLRLFVDPVIQLS